MWPAVAREYILYNINATDIATTGKQHYDGCSAFRRRRNPRLWLNEIVFSGEPFKAAFPLKPEITVYGVAYCGSRGRQNVGGLENMRKAWDKIAIEYKIMR